ncbi:hypothetical protein H7K45_21385 [Mycobacterium yunnanensis]|uniref:Mce-associated membrane protein n=1 Tax=Mycobacterium yunnanensis TaxID=368477 RepID=A0A9X3C3J9_9MYCO|nr:hypothetical protein [Mycobacterium yunnanensis]
MTDAPEPATRSEDLAALAAEAEAEAQAAEATAAAARARAKAVTLRRLAAASAAPVGTPQVDVPDVGPGTTEVAGATDVPDATEVPDAGRPARRRLRPRLPRIGVRSAAAALVVLCSLGFLGASGYMTWQHRMAAAEQQRSAEFAAAARQGVVTLMSLNFNNAQDDVKRILDNTTGDFKKDFEGQSEQFASVAQSSKVITEATVTATGVQAMTEDTATVLVAVTTQVSNAASKEQQPRSWRLRVDLARDGGRLKLAKVEFVP